VEHVTLNKPYDSVSKYSNILNQVVLQSAPSHGINDVALNTCS
jgi:hypothetical protein